jgi:catechol 2,3-dioxygenase-like lactoylglutathione lyase family enzyme
MPEIKGCAHFSIPVSDLAESTKFYTDVVGMKHLFTTPNHSLAFLDAGGVCVILVKHEAPINPMLDGSEGVHHSFIIDSAAYKSALDHLRKNGVEVFFEEDRQGGVINGPRAYFRDPDGTALEFIDLTSYNTRPSAPR